MRALARVVAIMLGVALAGCSSNGCGVYRYELAGEPTEAQLVAALKAESPQARAIAARGLGAMGPSARAAAPALREALHDTDEGVRREAAAALKLIEGEPTGKP